jgi:hypothetical protein
MSDSDWRWFRRTFGNLRTLGCSGGCLGLIAVAINLFVGALAALAGSSDRRLDNLGTALLPSIGCVLLGAFGAWLYGEHMLPVGMRPRSHQLGAVLMGVAGLGLTTVAILYVAQGFPSDGAYRGRLLLSSRVPVRSVRYRHRKCHHAELNQSIGPWKAWTAS